GYIECCSDLPSFDCVSGDSVYWGLSHAHTSISVVLEKMLIYITYISGGFRICSSLNVTFRSVNVIWDRYCNFLIDTQHCRIDRAVFLIGYVLLLIDVTGSGAIVYRTDRSYAIWSGQIVYRSIMYYC